MKKRGDTERHRLRVGNVRSELTIIVMTNSRFYNRV